MRPFATPFPLFKAFFCVTWVTLQGACFDVCQRFEYRTGTVFRWIRYYWLLISALHLHPVMRHMPHDRMLLLVVDRQYLPMKRLDYVELKGFCYWGMALTICLNGIIWDCRYSSKTDRNIIDGAMGMELSESVEQ